MRRGPPQSGLSLVLSLGARRRVPDQGGGRSRRRKGTARRNCRRLVELPCGRRSWGSRRTVHWRRDFSGRGLRPPSRPPDLPGICRCPGLALARRFYVGDLCRFARRGLRGPIVLKFDLGKISEGFGPKDAARRVRRRAPPVMFDPAKFNASDPSQAEEKRPSKRICGRKWSKSRSGGVRSKKFSSLPPFRPS